MKLSNANFFIEHEGKRYRVSWYSHGSIQIESDEWSEEFLGSCCRYSEAKSWLQQALIRRSEKAFNRA